MSFIIYRVLLFIQGRRALQVFYGLLIILFSGFLAQILKLQTISWLVMNLFAIWVIALLIVFQPELRRGLARLGRNPFTALGVREEVIDEIVKASNYLSRNRHGAILVVGREMGLRDYMESGVMIDSYISSELITTIFTPTSPLHDGAVIIEEERIMSANCILPVPEEMDNLKGMGARHRAALNLSRETDAVVIVISEETGKISLAFQGKLEQGLDGITLREKLREILLAQGGRRRSG